MRRRREILLALLLAQPAVVAAQDKPQKDKDLSKSTR